VQSSRLLIAPFENLTGDPRFDYVGRIAASRLALSFAENGSIDVVPMNIVLMALRDTTGGTADRIQRLSTATRAGFLASGSVVQRGDSLEFQAQVSDLQTGKPEVTLPPVSGPTTDPSIAIDALGDRLMGALGLRRDAKILPRGYRAPSYAASREFAAGFERFTGQGDVIGSRPFFERAIALDSTYTQAYQLLARQYINAGEFDRADSMFKRIDRLSGGLTPAERLISAYARAELSGSWARMLRAAEELVARDSSALALYLAGEARVAMLRPSPATLEAAQPTYDLMGGGAAQQLRRFVAESYHETGAYDRELRALLELQRLHPSAEQAMRARRLRSYAGSKAGATALTVADSVLRDAVDSTGTVAMAVTVAAEEFRAHGDPATATRLLSMVGAWYARVPARSPVPERRFSEGVALLMSGAADSAALRFASVARDTTRIDAAGYLGLAAVARNDRAGARAIADSLGVMRRPWLFGANTFYRAAIMGALGDRPLAVQLLQQAHTEGQWMDTWHYTSALDSLHGYAPFETLVRPER
jgi:TolB-like protein/tetratricopeptide (TPR) repeat protein